MKLKWSFRSSGGVFTEHLGAAAIFHVLKRHLDFDVSHTVDCSILGDGYKVIFMVLTIGISFFTASLGAEGHGNDFSFERNPPTLFSLCCCHLPSSTCFPSTCCAVGLLLYMGDRKALVQILTYSYGILSKLSIVYSFCFCTAQYI